MPLEVPIAVYGSCFTQEEINERRTWHDTTYLEMCIPVKLEKKLSKIIAKEVLAFEKKCKCGLCKLHKRRK